MATYRGSSGRAVLIFQIGEHVCALPCSRVQEIIPMALMIQTPAAPSIMEGVLNLRGSAIPVIKLRRLFGLPPAGSRIYTPVIIGKFGSSALGLVVDRVDEVVTIDPVQMRPLSEHDSLNHCAEGQVTIDGRGVILLDCDRLFLYQEQSRLADLQAEAQSRLDELEVAPS